MKIQAAVLESRDGTFALEELELDEPGPGEVLVRLAGTGICHTDSLTRHGDLPFPFPCVLGHEGAGIVVSVGAGVTSVIEDDPVVIGWPSCGICRNCRDGQPRYCSRLGEAVAGGHRLDGGPALRRSDGSDVASHFFGQSSFATHALTTATALVKVPASVPLELVGPLACGLSTGAGAVFHTARPRPGASLVIYGVGTVGLAAVMAALNTPATTIIAVDRHPSRLALATELGATHVVDASSTNPVEAVFDLCKGPADFSLECTGIISVCRQAVDSVGMLGTCILIGGAPAGAELAVDHLTTLWGKSIIGTLGGSGRSEPLISALLELHAAGRFPFDRLVHYYELSAIEEAIAASASGEVIKPVLRMPTS